jgi:hypothetical protein
MIAGLITWYALGWVALLLRMFNAKHVWTCLNQEITACTVLAYMATAPIVFLAESFSACGAIKLPKCAVIWSVRR